VIILSMRHLANSADEPAPEQEYFIDFCLALAIPENGDHLR
jgi:hypothetical protein